MQIDLSSADGNQQPVDKVREYLKCKMNPLYFIENYVQLPVAGGRIPIKESELWWSTPKYRQLVKAVHELDAVSFMSSRQHGKTSSIGMILLHYLLFFPKIQIEYVTLDAKRANDMVKRMKEMLDSLPLWLQMPFKGKSEKVTYIELENGSRMNSNYVSGSIDPDKLGRGMSSPIIYVDETAFIPKMDIVWAAMQPAISAARVFAKKNGYPTAIIFSTTPNGAGQNFFYNMWARGHDSSEVFEGDTIKFREDYEEILEKDPEKNSFVNVKIHWSETNKDEAWYKQQIKELNFNMRKVSQELDLVFLGSSNAVFPDEVLEVFEPKTPTAEITMGYGEKFKLYDELDPTKLYLLGVDTAASTGAKADYSAMTLMDASTGEEVGSWHGKFSVVKRFAVVVKSLIQGLSELYKLTEDSLAVIIERNSFGLGTIEELLFDDGGFDYTSYVYHEVLKNGERRPGLLTSAKSRDMMFNLLLSTINEMPERARSALLQEELRNLEQKNSGRFEAVQGAHDDNLMAYNFGLYVRHEYINQGLIETDGRTSMYDLSKANYFIDATMATSDPGVVNKKGELIQTINNDYEDDRKRLLDEFGYDKNYEAIPSVDNFVITF